MLRFNDIADRLLEYHPSADLVRLQSAYVFCAKVHEGQERLSGEPYLIHPLEVAGILVDMRVDDETVIAGLLHDTIEDTLATEQELEELFGERVAFLVDGLTKIARIEFRSQRERQAENFRKMLVAMSKDIRILLIKLADRLHNMRTLSYLGESARRRVAQETVDIYVPLAHRMGIYWMKQELQDLAFRALDPDAAEALEQHMQGISAERESYMEEVIGILSRELSAGGLQAEVSGRLKELASVYSKMKSQGLTFDEIYDVIAFRVIIEGGTAECYNALGIVHTTWRPVPGRFKDYVALPKPNGYQSLHTAVIGPYGERMEIQIRSREMHRDAELGVAAHWKYKEGRIDESEDERKFAWLRRLVEQQDMLADPHEFIDAVKFDLFADEVFVFTPGGDVINLPSRSTVVDFAYAIHTEVGDHCAGAKINGKMVPLRQTLTDGDRISIMTSPTQTPRKEWLETVVSSKARSRIRHELRRVERLRSRELGRGILEKELRKHGFSLSKLEKDGRLEQVAQVEIKRGHVDDLYAAVAYGKISHSAVVRHLRGDEAEPDAPEEPRRDRSLRSFFRRERPARSEYGITVSGQSDVLVRFAGGCEPLPGDEITGFVTRGRGVTIHAKDCRRAFEFDPERRIDVEWEAGATAPRRIRLRVSSRDEPGILAKITNSISEAGINIGDTRIKTKPGEGATQSFELWVADVEVLNTVMKDIRKVKGVQSVERVRG